MYSRSGTDPDFPPLASAFGKIDRGGPDTLANTWLNIHPNCLHVLIPWTPAGRTAEEIQEIECGYWNLFRFNPAAKAEGKNPFTLDPRSQKEREAYRKKEKAREEWLRMYRQWERYRMTLGDKVPKTYQTFERHKMADDDKYHSWERLYREANRES